MKNLNKSNSFAIKTFFSFKFQFHPFQNLGLKIVSGFLSEKLLQNNLKFACTAHFSQGKIKQNSFISIFYNFALTSFTNII